LLSGAGGCDPWWSDNGDWEDTIGVALYFLGEIFLFLGIAIVCDDFFVASLEAISEKLHLSEDVAGATFMAAGSSAPELFSSTMSIVSPTSGSELGIGTIVGSAVFNILVIVGATVVCTGHTLAIDWKPLTRDCSFYFASVVTILIIFNDEVVYWWEGMIAVFCYLLYILFMTKNQYFMNLLESCERKKPGAVAPEEPAKEEQKEEEEMSAYNKAEDAEKGKEESKEDAKEDEEEEEEDESPFVMPENYKDMFLWAASLPWYAAFTITIPKCNEKKWESWYFVSFTTSIMWLGFISYIMVEWAAKLGCILNIPDVVMGNTLIAAGTSIPDALSSIVVAKQGMGDMAVANAVGSNVFDIWLGLGLPWFLYLPFDGGSLAVNTGDLIPNILILLAVLICYYGAIVLNGWKLTVRTGKIFMSLHVVYILYNVVVVWLIQGD